MSKPNGDGSEQDFIAAGFKKLDPNLIEKRPPKISWGKLYRAKSDAEKITYLEKLAATMNYAASLIQDERNQLNKLCELKEQQLTKMAESVEANNAMLQQEVTRMNEDRQILNAELIRLTMLVKKLEG